MAQEKGERARLLVSLRESHTNAQQAGDSEAKLRNEALEVRHVATVNALSPVLRPEFLITSSSIRHFLQILLSCKRWT